MWEIQGNLQKAVRFSGGLLKDQLDLNKSRYYWTISTTCELIGMVKISSYHFEDWQLIGVQEIYADYLHKAHG